MALEADTMCKGNASRSDSLIDGEVYERVKEFLKPLEKVWDYVQTVLLWQKPTHALGYFIALTATFSLISSGKFRIILLTGVLVASSLLFEDIRSRVWQILQQGGCNVARVDQESRDEALSFPRLCRKLAIIWGFLTAWLEKLNRLKEESLYKYYTALFGMLLVAVFIYQYLPLTQILYFSVCALYFWPAIKYLGINKSVKKALEPFYKPFYVQWQNSRTKRVRDSLLKGKEGENAADSDDEFAKSFHPTADKSSLHQDVSLGDESAPPPLSPPLEARLLQGLITSAVTQGLQNLTNNGGDAQEEEIPVPESPESFDSSAVFLEGLKFSSLSQAKDGLEFEEGDLMEGLEFPDIEKDTYSSSTESLHMVGNSGSDKNNEFATEIDARESSQTRPSSETPDTAMTSSRSTDMSDFEMLDQTEAEGMGGRDVTDTSTNSAATTGLGSVTSYVGKWLGY